jgi:ketopantoate reductase
LQSNTTIIGAGRVGSYLHSLRPTSTLLRRHDAFPQNSEGPIYLCVRNDDLGNLVHQIPRDRHADLVLLQNGMLQPFLRAHHLEDVTQAILYFAISKIGAPAEDGKNTVVTGKWSQDFCNLLAKGGIQCKEVPPKKFLETMAEKLLWNTIFGLICEVHRCSVGEAVTEHESEGIHLLAELQPIIERYCKIALGQNLWMRLRAYSLQIPSYRGALKEVEWRNKWFLQQESTPIHATLMTRAGMN